MSKLRKIVHLQTLRALSASVVVATHALEYPIRRHILGEDMYLLAWAIGWTGVASFFMISGLIMIRSGHDRFGSTSSARYFALNRLIRVVPLYWLAVIPFTAATLMRGETVTVVMVLKTMLFIPYHSPAHEAMRPVIGQGWTLNYEMLFYALFTVCLIFPRRIGLLILLLTFPIIIIMGAVFHPLIPYHDAKTVVQFLIDPVTLFFVAGMLIGLLELRLQAWHRVSHPIAWTLLAFVITVSAFVMGGGSFPMPIWWQALFGVSGAIAVVLCTSGGGHRFAKLGQVAEAAGDASYSTYLVHPLILMAMAALWGRLPVVWQIPVVFVVLAILLCNLSGYCCYRLIERPLSRWVRGRVAVGPSGSL